MSKAWSVLKNEGDCVTCGKPHKLLIEEGAKINEFGECSRCEQNRDYRELVEYYDRMGEDYYPSGKEIMGRYED